MRKPDVDLAALQDLVNRIYGQRGVVISRTSTGTTTQVYRLTIGAANHYLRVAEDRQDRSGAEVLAHRLLLKGGVRLPDIIHYEPFDATLDRSVLITTEIPGAPLGEGVDPDGLPSVLYAAGSDLARINAVPVVGFGFIDRSDPSPTSLTAASPDALTFIFDTLDIDSSPLPPTVDPTIDRRILDTVNRWQADLNILPATLAHGDFDGTHIFVDSGRYAGIIDFGEIRGADRLYDLGHFAVHTAGKLPTTCIDLLIAGYRSITEMTDADLQRIWLWAAIIGRRLLARVRLAPTDQRNIAARIEFALQYIGS